MSRPETWGMAYEKFLQPPDEEIGCPECGGIIEEPEDDCADEYHFRERDHVPEFEYD